MVANILKVCTEQNKTDYRLEKGQTFFQEIYYLILFSLVVTMRFKRIILINTYIAYIGTRIYSFAENRNVYGSNAHIHVM